MSGPCVGPSARRPDAQRRRRRHSCPLASRIGQPLRTLAIAGKPVFIAYGLLGARTGMLAEPMQILVPHSALLPLSLVRLREVRLASKAVRARTGRPSTTDFLTP